MLTASRHRRGDTGWDGVASIYRRQLWLEGRALETLLGMLKPEPSERLLDVASGPGVLLAELAERPSRPVEAIGIDSSREMIELAPPLPAGWELGIADATELPFADDSFELITASYLLHFLRAPERRRAIAEIARVLRPGGRLGSITVAPPRSRLAAALSAPIRAAAERSEVRLAGLRPLDPGPELQRAGLYEVERCRSMVGYPSLCIVAAAPAPGG